MLASLLTGLREIRTRLVIGFAWLFAGYLVIGHIFPKPPSATGVAADVYAAARFVTPAGVALALGALAYVIGIVAAQRIRMPGWHTFAARLALPSRVDDALTEVVVQRLAERLGDDPAVRGEVVRRTVAIGQSRGVVVDAALLDDLLRKESGLRQAAVRSLMDTAGPVAGLRERLPSVAGQAGPDYERLCAERDFRFGMAAPVAVLVATLALRGSPWWLLALLVPALLVRSAVTAGRDAQLLLVPRLEAHPEAHLEALLLDDLDVDTSWAWQAIRTVGALAVSPNATVVAGGTIDGRIHLWDTDSGEVIGSLPGHAREVTCLAFSPDGELLVSGGDDHRTRVWDVAAGEERHRIDHDEPVVDVAVNRDGVLVIGTRTTLTWWYPDTTRPSRTDLGSHVLDHMALDPDSKLLAVALDDGTLRVYVGEIPVDLATYEDLTLAGWSGLNPFVVGFTRAADEVELRSWDPLTGRAIHPVAVVAGQLMRPTLARPRGSSLAVADADDQVLLLDAQTGELTHTLTGHREPVTALAWSANGDVLASSAADGTVIVWDVAEGRQRLRLVPPPAGAPEAPAA